MKTEIYIATHAKHVEPDYYHIPIQVGAALNKERLQEVRDDIGDNISVKNPDYCELTALYWIWKNSDADIVGLEHYRRRFAIDEKEIGNVMADYDIIAAVPYRFRKSLEDEYISSHCAKDWILMKEAVLELYPELGDKMAAVFAENELIPFNMFIAGKKVCDEYCQWLFAILDRIEQKKTKGNQEEYQSRYIGFLAERLFTLYLKSGNLAIRYLNVQEQNKQHICTKVKMWMGQHILNPLIFKIERNR
jgi:hypothetical protein